MVLKNCASSSRHEQRAAEVTDWNHTTVCRATADHVSTDWIYSESFDLSYSFCPLGGLVELKKVWRIFASDEMQTFKRSLCGQVHVHTQYKELQQHEHMNMIDDDFCS